MDKQDEQDFRTAAETGFPCLIFRRFRQPFQNVGLTVEWVFETRHFRRCCNSVQGALGAEPNEARMINGLPRAESGSD